jgi:hypothetical protein
MSDKKVIKCAVYLQSQYGKIQLVYSPECTLGKQVLEYFNKKYSTDAKEIDRSSFRPSWNDELLTLVDIMPTKIPTIPKLPIVGQLVQSKVALPDFLR